MIVEEVKKRGRPARNNSDVQAEVEMENSSDEPIATVDSDCVIIKNNAKNRVFIEHIRLDPEQQIKISRDDLKKVKFSRALELNLIKIVKG